MTDDEEVATTAEAHDGLGVKLDAEEAEEAARHIEMLFADLEDLRRLRDDIPGAASSVRGIGSRTDVASARVALLNVLSKATLSDLVGDAEAMAVILVRDAPDDAVGLHVEFHPEYNHHDEQANPLSHRVAGSMFTHAAELLTGGREA